MRSVQRLLLAAVLTCRAGSALAQDYTIGPLKVSGAWSREVPQGSTVTGGYMTITNTGAEPDTLVGATLATAGKVEVHEMSMTGGVMIMRELKAGLVIKPGQTVALKPGSFHMMLMDLKERPKIGTPLKGTLVFQRAGTLAIEYRVEPIGSRGPAQ